MGAVQIMTALKHSTRLSRILSSSRSAAAHKACMLVKKLLNVRHATNVNWELLLLGCVANDRCNAPQFGRYALT